MTADDPPGPLLTIKRAVPPVRPGAVDRPRPAGATQRAVLTLLWDTGHRINSMRPDPA